MTTEGHTLAMSRPLRMTPHDAMVQEAQFALDAHSRGDMASYRRHCANVERLKGDDLPITMHDEPAGESLPRRAAVTLLLFLCTAFVVLAVFFRP